MISIVLTVYNGVKYLRECLDSLCNQTINESELEIIAVDDASIDDSLKILQEYEHIYPNLMRVISQKENSYTTGIPPRNIGYRESKGDYILFCDQDDIYTRDACEKLNDLMNNNPELDFIEYKFEYIDGDGSSKGFSNNLDYAGSLKKYYIGNDVQLLEMIKNRILPSYTYVWCRVYNKKYLEKYNIIHTEGELNVVYADNVFTSLAIMYATNIGKFYESLYKYRLWGGSYTGEANIQKEKNFERISTGLAYLQECRNRGIFEDKKDIIEFLFLRILLEKTYWCFIKEFDIIPYDKLREIKKIIEKECPQCKDNPLVSARKELYDLVKKLDYEWTDSFLDNEKMK